MSKIIDLTGQKFERLTVLKRYTGQKGGSAKWYCICDCGNAKIAEGYSLRAGRIKSCGCLHSEKSSENGKAARKHGMHGTRLYKEWSSMKTRCYNQRSPGYAGYGGRGITVCDEWINDFKPFYDWAISSGYDENAPRGKCTLERIDNDGPYSPDNCRWATNEEQQNNKRNNRVIEFNGKRQTLPQWAREKGINASTLHNRLNRGWSVERAMTESIHLEKVRSKNTTR